MPRNFGGAMWISSTSALAFFILIGSILSAKAQAYTDVIDTKIHSYLSQGIQLENQRSLLEDQQQSLFLQKEQLDIETTRLEKDRDSYNNAAAQFNEGALEHKQKIHMASEECQSFGPKKNLDQLAQAADTASAGLYNPVVNNNARQMEEYARKCNSKFKKINDKTLQMALDKSSLSNQYSDLEKRSLNHSEKVTEWNRHEDQVITDLNETYQKINAWQNEAEKFMSSDEFQAQIRWAKVGEICTMPDFEGAHQEKMIQISNYIFGCLNAVETKRKHFYSH